MNQSTRELVRKADWKLSENAFARLLEFLDNGKPTGGSAYLDMRRRLVDYFDRKNCVTPDDYADETLNRVARRLEEEGRIVTDAPAKYCYTVARFVFLESLRSPSSRHQPLDELNARLPDRAGTVDPYENEAERKEIMFQCLEACSGQLETASRDLIVRYYFGTERIKIENRRSLASELGISVNALSIRACRIREKLHTCVSKCVAGK